MTKTWGMVGAGVVLGALSLLAGCPTEKIETGGEEAENGTLYVWGDAGMPADAAPGINCTIPTTSGGKLCTETKLCPGLEVDQGIFPGCGFLVLGSLLSVDCECSGQLCSGGATETCDEVALLLAEKNANLICDQVADGKCVVEQSPDGGGTDCDAACESECLGVESCVLACGC